MVCGSCGLPVSTIYLAEAVQLHAWRASTDARLAWLYDRMRAGDVPVGTSEGRPLTGSAPSEAVAAARHPATAGSLLLAVGAFLLVAAGIAFIAFTWDLLGPFGQIAVLLVLGAACLASSYRLSHTLRGTGTAIGIVGALLVAIAALGARFLGPDLIGAVASLLAAVVILAALAATGRWMRPRTAAVGELAGATGATLLVALVAFAPGDDAVPIDDPWQWWTASWMFVSAAALVVFADRMRMRTWPWVGAFYLVTGSVALATWAVDVLDALDEAGAEATVFALALGLASAVVSLTLQRVGHHVAVLSAALVVWVIALAVAWFTAVDPRDPNGWPAVVVLAVGAVGLLLAQFGTRAKALRAVVTVVAAAAMASAVGAGIPPYVASSMDLDPQAWADDAWPAWRGVVAGLAMVVVLVVTSAVTRRLTDRLTPSWLVAALPIVTTAAALGTWLAASQAAVAQVTAPRGPYAYEPEPTPDAYLQQVAVALVVVAVGMLVMALLRRIPAWAGWLVPVLAIPAVLMVLSTVTIDGPLTPEILGVWLAIPAAVAAVSWWWLRRPVSTPTWQTMAPPFVLAVLPSTVALLQDTAGRWWYDEDPSAAYQVRVVALVAVAVVAAIVGARQRWAGLFFPGIVLALVVLTVELVDLGRFLPQWVSFGLAGAALVAAGARWEWLRNRGKEGAAWVRGLR